MYAVLVYKYYGRKFYAISKCSAPTKQEGTLFFHSKVETTFRNFVFYYLEERWRLKIVLLR